MIRGFLSEPFTSSQILGDWVREKTSHEQVLCQILGLEIFWGSGLDDIMTAPHADDCLSKS